MSASTWFRIPVLGRYFKWLENSAPTGTVDQYPVVSDSGETDNPGVYIAGDLTGIPLLKLAADGGAAIVDRLHSSPGFQTERKKRPDDSYDLIIVGAGVAGTSAALSAREKGLKFKVLEADRAFTTIRNFPAKKPISIYPKETKQRSSLLISGDNKEDLLSNLEDQIKDKDLPIALGGSVTSIEGNKGSFVVKTRGKIYSCLRVLLAIGKNGESRRLGVPGEDKAKVLSRLIDPADFKGKNILVVGGGDSAVESALLLADQEDTKVTLSYRGTSLTRPKPENVKRAEEAGASGKIDLALGSTVTEIEDTTVTLKTPDSEPTHLANDIVFTLIGHKPPTELLTRAGVGIEGAWTTGKKILLAALLFFSAMLYFGKSSNAFIGDSLIDSLLGAPSAILRRPWNDALMGILAWISLLGFAATGSISLGIIGRRLKKILASGWATFKTLYFLGVGLFVAYVYVSDDYLGSQVGGKDLGFWYTFLYSLTIFVFGLRRILFRKSRYITVQTSVLIGVQVLFLFLLPEFILPWMGKSGMLGQWVMDNLFPNGSYWRSYGFILAWPLFFSNLLYGMPTTAWLVISLVQTFAIIPLFVWRFGKGAYCGWICSCGGLAETLGDEYRTLAPHGRGPRSLEHAGQIILFIVAALSIWNLLAPSFLPDVLSNSRKAYKVVVDVGLAGVVGVGVYFFLSGRAWCRFFCPLAALMHIYTRFSVYRIFADKKKCISCGLCTRTCHMGIDVMNYANIGRPMDDYECVRCSACVYSCPVSCLNFGRVTENGPRPTLFGLKEERPEHLVSGHN